VVGDRELVVTAQAAPPEGEELGFGEQRVGADGRSAPGQQEASNRAEPGRMHPTTHLRPAAVPPPGPPTTTSPWTPAFLATFVAAWLALDRLVSSPPTVVS
jgi:hypothetical protein